MVLAPEQSWKLVLAIVLCVAIVLSARARAPRRAVPHGEPSLPNCYVDRVYFGISGAGASRLVRVR